MNDEIITITDDEVQELLTLINVSQQNNETSVYVFFDSASGAIKSISSNLNELELPYIEITNPDEKNKLQKQDAFYKFRIAFDPESRKNLLVDAETDVDQITNIDDLIFQFPQTTSITDEDFVIIQNIKDKKWKFVLSNELSNSLIKCPLAFDFYSLYITDFNDPNILHRTVIVPMRELIDNKFYDVDFISSYESDSLSIFARKHFKTHVHIRDEYEDKSY